MNKIKNWFMNLSADKYLGIIFIIGFFVWILNLYLPLNTVTFFFSWVLVGVICFSVLGMIVRLIIRIIRDKNE